jgi:hypothetical protein
MMPLAATGLKNKIYPLKYTCHPNKTECQSNIKYSLVKIADEIKFSAIIISTKIDLTMIETFEIGYGDDNILFSIPFNLLYKLSHVVIKDNNYNIMINDDILFIDHEYFSTLLYEVNTYCLKTKFNKTFGYEIATINRIYQLDYRNILRDRVCQLKINEYQHVNLNLKNKIKDKNKDKDKDKDENMGFSLFDESEYGNRNTALSSGLFIETNDYIEHFSMHLNGQQQMHYDKFEIDAYTDLIHVKKGWYKEHLDALENSVNMVFSNEIIDKINGYCEYDNDDCYLYWFPFEPGKKWNDKNLDMTINFARIDQTELDIQTKFKLNNYKIYVLGHNILMCSDMMIAKQFI